MHSGGMLLATLAGGTTTYHHSDHLSVRMSTNSSGVKVGEQGHYPYGEAWYQVNTTTKFIFTSYERDPESGNDYAMARYYRVGFGRFCSPDPLAGSPGDPQSWNRYVYARDNPISIVDPSGMGWLISLSSFFHFLASLTPNFTALTPPFIDPPNNGAGIWQKLEDAIVPPMSGGTPPIFGFLGIDPGVLPDVGGGGVNWAGMLNNALNHLSDRCKTVLPYKDLQNGVRNLHFFDARSMDSPDALQLASAFNPGMASKPLWAIGQGVSGLDMPTKSPDGVWHNSNNILIGSEWDALDTQQQQATLVHEEWHAVTDLKDPGLWRVATNNGAVATPGVPWTSGEITNWIAGGCQDESKK